MALQEPYLYWLSSRTSIFRDVRGLFCVVSSSVSFSNHKPYLERYGVSYVVASLLVFFHPDLLIRITIVVCLFVCFLLYATRAFSVPGGEN